MFASGLAATLIKRWPRLCSTTYSVSIPRVVSPTLSGDAARLGWNVLDREAMVTYRHKEASKQASRQAYKQTDRQACRRADRQANGKNERQT